MNGLAYRLPIFIRPSDNRSLIVDASAGLSVGVLPGLDDFSRAVQPCLRQLEGIVCSPGQLRRLTGLTRAEAGLLVRMDWTNTLREKDFVLPVNQPLRVPILSAQDAFELGAVGMVSTFLLGYEEEVEAASLKSTVQLALEGKARGLPLVVEVRPTGPRVSLAGKAVELGASYALEGGADVIALPYPGRDSLKTIGAFVSVPWLVRATNLQTATAELNEALSCGAAGLWLDGAIFGEPDPAAMLAGWHQQVHAQPGEAR
jgi:DhnA family fructose-bisphosphate aldolase class Ia